MLPLERLWHDQNRTPVLAISGIIILVIAVVDWWTKPYVSLGFLYLFPIMFAAAFLPRWFVALLGVVCAVLAELFSSLAPSFVRLTFETLALAGCGFQRLFRGGFSSAIWGLSPNRGDHARIH